jgi:hypothetical protein
MTFRASFQRITFPEGSIVQHGSRSGYELGCRCEPCVIANRLYKRKYADDLPYDEYVAQRTAKREKHGAWGYARGCRCVACKTASADRRMPYQKKVHTELRTLCPGCGRLFRGQAGLTIHKGKGCPGPVLERIGYQPLSASSKSVAEGGE